MEKVNTLQEIIDYVSNATQVSPGRPILIDKYIDGREVEVDAVSDGECVLIPGIMEHIERAGVHSGDSFSIYPARNLSEREINTIIEYTEKISKALNVKGLINIQFAVKEGTVYVLEVNPRASRTVPIMSKATGIPMVKLAVEVALGKKLKELGYKGGLWPQTPYTVVKAPVFSMEKLTDVEVSLSPEMKSTGEIMGIDLTYEGALYKALEGAGLKIPKKGKILLSIAERDFQEAVSLVEKLQGLGYEIYATYRTGKYLSLMGIHVNIMSLDNAIKLLKDGYFDAVVNTPTKGKKPDNTGFKLRRTAVEYRIPLFTSIDTIKAALNAVSKVNVNGLSILSVNEYQEMQKDNVKNLVL